MAPSSPPSPSPTTPLVHSSFPVRRNCLLIVPAVTRASDGCALDHELERRWSAVKARLSLVQAAMHAARPVRTEPRYWVDVYTEVAYLYTHNDALRKRRMYLYVRQFVRDLVADQLKLLQKLPHGPVLLAEYCRTWRATMSFVLFMKRVLHHLHRFWIPDNANTLKDDPVRPLDKLLMFYWREDLLSQMPHIVEIALQMVDQDRRGDPIDHRVVRGVVDTLVEIGTADIVSPDPRAPPDQAPTSLPTLHLYIRVFEDDFLALTRTFYKAEGEKMVAVGNVTHFMKNVLARLDEEAERGKRLLHPDSGPRLRQATEEQLIGNHIGYLQKEASEMIKAGREDDLKLVYTLLNRIENGLAPLRTFFVGYVRAEGNSVVVEHIDKMTGKDDMRSNLGLVRVLIKLYRKHASLVKRCFNGSNVIMMAIDDAFRGFANRALGNISLPNLIAHYVDHVLRLGKAFDREMWDTPDEENATRAKRARLSENASPPGTPSSSTKQGSERQPAGPQGLELQDKPGEKDDSENSNEESALARYLTELVRLFMFLDDKDLFFETHRRLFAKRLMSNHDEDLEMSFINKVKVQMGPTYTQRLSGMLKDKFVSNTMRMEFLKYFFKKREDCERRKAEATKVVPRDISEEDIITPVVMESDAENIITDTIITPMDIPREPFITSRNTAPPETNRTSGWSMLLNVTNAHSEKDKAERKDREEKSKKIDEKILEFEDALRIDFNTHVLNALHWPAVKVANLRLPPVLQACQELFSDFYMRDKETRKLAWIHTLSTVNLLGSIGDKQYTLVVSTFQACILLLFNDSDSISVSNACSLLNLTRDELHHHIKPLILSRKCKVLKLERRSVSGLGDATVEDAHNLNDAEKSGQLRAVENNGKVSDVEKDEKGNGETVCNAEKDERAKNVDKDEMGNHADKDELVHEGENDEIVSDVEKDEKENDADNNERTTDINKNEKMNHGEKEEEMNGEDKEAKNGDEDKDEKVQDSVWHAASEDQQGPYQNNELPSNGEQAEKAQNEVSAADRISAVQDFDGAAGNNSKEIVSNTVPTTELPSDNDTTASVSKPSLNKTPQTEGKNVEDDEDDKLQDSDVIHINLAFKSIRHRVVVPASIAKLASTEAAVSKRNVVVDRSTQVDAMLVRIMKAKKEITHAALIAELIEALAPMFLPDPRLIKTRLERLIDQEYVERDSNDPRLYRYAA